MVYRNPRTVLATALAAALLAPAATANSALVPNGAQLTRGNTANGQGLVGISHNPASGAFAQAVRPARVGGGSASLQAGVEYGDVEELFDMIDELSNDLTSSTGSGDGSTDDGAPSTPIDVDNPRLDALMDYVNENAARVGAALALIAAEGYVNAHTQFDLPLLFATEVWGGTITGNFSSQLRTKAIGVADEINFDRDLALSELEAAYNLTSSSPLTTFDLSGGLTLTVDPANQTASFQFDNDSTLVSRTASYNEFAVGYSTELRQSEHSALYVGATPKLVYVGLSQIGFRFGDITDSEDVWDDVRDADREYDNAFSLDLGAIWRWRGWHVGLTGSNLTEPEFNFPTFDTSGLTDPQLIAYLQGLNSVKLDAQWNVEAGWLSDDRNWAVNLAYDTDDASDIMNDRHQWAVMSVSYWSDTWWLPGIRAGYRENLAGTELRYYQLGFSFLRYLNLDIGMSPDSVNIDGDELPRGVMFSLGADFTF